MILVEEAKTGKAKLEKTVNQVAKYFVACYHNNAQ